MSNYSGYWIGTFNGTNEGRVTVELKDSAGSLSGTASFREPRLGQYEYDVSGTASDAISLQLKPTKATGGVLLGDIQVIGKLQADGALAGRWQSSIGTQGVFQLTRHDSGGLQTLIPASNSVFLVHGHDDGAMQAVARFLEKIGAKPVILHEQINRGMTLIEKFEDFAKAAGFAVVLMTPDDFGHPAQKEELKKARPRQNVILELGYFFARLGRTRVFVLVRGDLEMPSDTFGLVYEPMDASEGWKMKLARELKASGFQVDLNRALA